MNCPACKTKGRKHGRNRHGTQRFRCPSCQKTFSEARDSVGNMYLPLDKASLVVNLLVEGNSIRATEKITGVHHTTILSLLKTVGHQCAQFQTDRVRSVPVRDLQVDEVWGFVGKKQRRIGPYEDRESLGDAYCFLALERQSKLTVAWHLGRWNVKTTYELFMAKVRKAMSGHFQLSSDAFSAYRGAVDFELWDRADYAQITKLYGRLPGAPGDYYRPAKIKGTMWASVMGSPRRDRVCTSHVERMNGSIRLFCKRLNRLTYAFSKRWKMLEAALSLPFAHYNFCRVHGSLKVTPAMEAALTGHVWTVSELLRQVA